MYLFPKLSTLQPWKLWWNHLKCWSLAGSFPVLIAAVTMAVARCVFLCFRICILLKIRYFDLLHKTQPCASHICIKTRLQALCNPLTLLIFRPVLLETNQISFSYINLEFLSSIAYYSNQLDFGTFMLWCWKSLSVKSNAGGFKWLRMMEMRQW